MNDGAFPVGGMPEVGSKVEKAALPATGLDDIYGDDADEHRSPSLPGTA